MTGLVSHCAGLSAEAAVEAHLVARGARPVARRWRGAGGEIDLILEEAGVIVFVEVKHGRDFATATRRIGPAQQARLFAAAETFLGTLPGGTLRDCRFDVALVDGQGWIEIVENAFL